MTAIIVIVLILIGVPFLFALILGSWSSNYAKEQDEKQMKKIKEEHERFMEEIKPALDLADKINKGK